MKINSISIVPQEVGCNAKCKYCIARMTHDVNKNIPKPGICLPKLDKCLQYAKDNGATTAIITSHGETLLGSWKNIENIAWLCRKYFGQVDLHTNASEILTPPKFGRDFSQMIAPYLTNITLTVPDYRSDKVIDAMGFCLDYSKLFKMLKDLGLVIRLSCVVCKSYVGNFEEFKNYIDIYKASGISQIVFRELWIPKINSPDVWSEENVISRIEIDNWACGLRNCKLLDWYGNGQPYDYQGVAISTSTCTRNNSKELIKSVVYNIDNYLYTDWDSTCKIM